MGGSPLATASLGAAAFAVAIGAIGAIGACALTTSFEGLAGERDGDGGAGGLDGGAPGDGATSEGVPDSGECPGGKGPMMVRVGTFCIDSTEVTKLQYSAFVTDDAAPSRPLACSWKTPSKAPGSGYPPANAELETPVNFVDWCDAYAFCAWAGKRLCGRIGGGTNAMASFDDPTRSQWFAACTNSGATRFPYGNTYDPQACYGREVTPDGLPRPARKSCQGGVPGLFDMSGNVDEWEDSCERDNGRGDLCMRRGGGNDESGDFMACDVDKTDRREARNVQKGFRCCSN